MNKINREFRLLTFSSNRIVIQNDITRIDIIILSDRYLISIRGKKTGSYKRYIKSSIENNIPEQYKEIIDNYLIMHKLTL